MLGGDLELGGAGICLDFGHAHLLGGAPEADAGNAADVLRRTVGARARLRAILDDLARPFDFGPGT